jgi:hypothetical protein
LLEGVELGHVLLDGGAVALPGAEEALVLGAVEPEPLLGGAVVVAQASPVIPKHRATLLAQALTAIHGRMSAIALPVAVTANVDPIPVCKDTPILNSDYINILDAFEMWRFLSLE